MHHRTCIMHLWFDATSHTNLNTLHVYHAMNIIHKHIGICGLSITLRLSYYNWNYLCSNISAFIFEKKTVSSNIIACMFMSGNTVLIRVLQYFVFSAITRYLSVTKAPHNIEYLRT